MCVLSMLLDGFKLAMVLHSVVVRLSLVGCDGTANIVEVDCDQVNANEGLERSISWTTLCPIGRLLDAAGEGLHSIPPT